MKRSQIGATYKRVQLIWALVVSVAFVIALCVLFDPQWWTNDDVGMSMVAHGYGIAAVGSPKLVFSHVLWGYMVRPIPQISEVVGYSIATLSVLAIVGFVFLYALRILGYGWIVSMAVLVLLLTRPVLFPQFTVNAGLLTVSAIVCWHLFGQSSNRQYLLAGFLLAFSGYLVRSLEFLHVLLVSLPLIPWQALARDQFSKVAVAGFVVAIGISAVIDYRAYQGDDWLAYNAFQPVRAIITDYGGDKLLKQRPDILARHSYTSNDINLIRGWFFVDPKITNPDALSAMFAELGSLPLQGHSLANGWKGVKTLTDPMLLPLLLVALLLLLMKPSRWLLMVWGLSIAGFFVLGLIGRPGKLRVYVAVVSLLSLAPLLLQGTEHKAQGILRKRLPEFLIALCALINAASVFSQSATAQMSAKQIRAELQNFPAETVVAWGSGFPYEATYAVLGPSEKAKAFKLYGLGASTLAPFSIAYAEQMAGRGFVNRLMSENGIKIVGSKRHFNLLSRYCKEHFNAAMKELSYQDYGRVALSVRRCEAK